jgi:hypothetical protein
MEGDMGGVDARWVFDAAYDFLIASKILEEKFGQKVFPLRSTIVNTAFSVELYLKYLDILAGSNSRGARVR